ncbi:MAG: lysylphosphatidylglycerol synthase transmembrane domain-containing protein [Pseudomonadota bacterium]
MNLRQAIRITVAVFFVVAIVFVALEFATSSADEIWSKLASITFGQWAAVLGLALINYLLRAIRWQVYLRTVSIELPLRSSLFHYIGGFAFTLTPARVGELVRLHWVAENSGRPEPELLPLGLMDRVSDLLATGVLLATALAFTSFGGLGALVPVLFAFGIVYVATHPKILRGSVEFAYRIIRRFPRVFCKMRRSLGEIRVFMRPKVLWPTTVLGVIGWLAEAYALYLILIWLGAPLEFWVVVAIFKTALLGGGATGLPGGVGGIEAIMVGLFWQAGVPIEVALAATAIIRAATLWFAILLGFLAFPVAQWSTGKRAHAVEI